MNVKKALSIAVFSIMASGHSLACVTLSIDTSFTVDGKSHPVSIPAKTIAQGGVFEDSEKGIRLVVKKPPVGSSHLAEADVSIGGLPAGTFRLDREGPVSRSFVPKGGCAGTVVTTRMPSR